MISYRVMGDVLEKPDPVVAYRELEAVATSLLAACEREELDAVMAEIGRREEVQKRLELLELPELEAHRGDILPILERVKGLDRTIEPKLKQMLIRTSEKLRSVANSKKLLELYIKETRDPEAKFLDRRG
jgi:hypothetical protein